MLTPKQKKHLKSLAHHLKPVVMLGQHGLTEAVVKECDQALETHELIKVKITGDDREERSETAISLAQQTNSELVHTIGHQAILYRLSDKQRITL
jgi:RNA-binding protein